MTVFPQMMMPGNVSVIPDATFIVNNDEDADTSSKTWSGVSLGAPSPFRWIVLLTSQFHATDTNAMTACTIAGVSATPILTPSTLRVQAWKAYVPAGLTGDIVFTWAGTINSHGYGVFRVIHPTGDVVDSAVNNSDGGDITLSSKANGFVLAWCFSSNGTAGAFGGDGVVEEYEADMRSNEFYAGGSDAKPGTEAAFSVTHTTANAALAAVSF